MKVPRRRFLHLAAGTVAFPAAPRICNAEEVAAAPFEPLVWPVVPKVPAGVRSFATYKHGARHRRTLWNAGEFGHFHRRQPPDGLTQRRHSWRIPGMG